MAWGRVSEDTAEYYVNVVRAGEWLPGKGKHVKAWRKYVHYLFSIGALSWEQYQAYLLVSQNKWCEAQNC